MANVPQEALYVLDYRDWTQEEVERALIDFAALSPRTRWRLMRNDYKTAEQVRRTPDVRLLCLRQFGQNMLREVRSVMPYEPKGMAWAR